MAQMDPVHVAPGGKPLYRRLSILQRGSERPGQNIVTLGGDIMRHGAPKIRRRYKCPQAIFAKARHVEVAHEMKESSFKGDWYRRIRVIATIPARHSRKDDARRALKFSFKTEALRSFHQGTVNRLGGWLDYIGLQVAEIPKSDIRLGFNQFGKTRGAALWRKEISDGHLSRRWTIVSGNEIANLWVVTRWQKADINETLPSLAARFRRMNHWRRVAVSHRQMYRHELADVTLDISIDEILCRDRIVLESGGKFLPVLCPVSCEHSSNLVARPMTCPAKRDGFFLWAFQKGRIRDHRTIRAVADLHEPIEPPAHSNLLLLLGYLRGRQVGKIKQVAASGAQVSAAPGDILVASNCEERQTWQHHSCYVIRW